MHYYDANSKSSPNILFISKPHYNEYVIFLKIPILTYYSSVGKHRANNAEVAGLGPAWAISINM